jgi:hypothetical protein
VDDGSAFTGSAPALNGGGGGDDNDDDDNNKKKQQQQQYIKFYATGGFQIRNTTLTLRDREHRHIVVSFL